MAAPVVATPARSRTTIDFTFLIVAAVLVIAVVGSLFALTVWSRTSIDNGAVVESTYASGYPLHGGLAGPSRVSVFEQHQGYAPGYPLNGGLAGPSRVGNLEHSGFGPGYPLNGGLAGPSQLDDGR